MNPVDSAYRYEPLLHMGQWFAELPVALKTMLLDAATVVHLHAGQVLFEQNDPAHGLYAVISGCISVSRQRADGKEALLTLMESPHWFGEITLFDRMKRTHNAVALSETVLIHIRGETLDQLLKKEPHYWQNFGQLLTDKVRMLLNQAEDLALLSSAQRLANRLVFFAENAGHKTDRSRRVIPIPQEQLAMMLYLTRQTTNQLLKDLERQGLIKLVYGAIEILDLEGLRTFANPAEISKSE